MSIDAVRDKLLAMPPEVLQEAIGHLVFRMPWQSADAAGGTDPDGFTRPHERNLENLSREELQGKCWVGFNRNPQINTSVRGLAGRITGYGFETTSGLLELQTAIEDIELDWRNRLYHFWPKWVARAFIEGELFLLLSLHEDGFVEVDFIDPARVSCSGDDDTGIIFHSRKEFMPLFYNIAGKDTGSLAHQIPSIFIARNPELVENARKHTDWNLYYQLGARSLLPVYAPFGGYRQFIVAWDKGFMTRRAVSYLRTTLEPYLKEPPVPLNDLGLPFKPYYTTGDLC